ncbi:unnamed protein product, partial [Trichogramma brassicae]
QQQQLHDAHLSRLFQYSRAPFAKHAAAAAAAAAAKVTQICMGSRARSRARSMQREMKNIAAVHAGAATPRIYVYPLDVSRGTQRLLRLAGINPRERSTLHYAASPTTRRRSESQFVSLSLRRCLFLWLCERLCSYNGTVKLVNEDFFPATTYYNATNVEYNDEYIQLRLYKPAEPGKSFSALETLRSQTEILALSRQRPRSAAVKKTAARAENFFRVILLLVIFVAKPAVDQQHSLRSGRKCRRALPCKRRFMDTIFFNKIFLNYVKQTYFRAGMKKNRIRGSGQKSNARLCELAPSASPRVHNLAGTEVRLSSLVTYKYCEFSEEERSNPNYVVVRSILELHVPNWACRTFLSRLTIEEVRHRFTYASMRQRPDEGHVPTVVHWLERDGVVLVKCRDSQSKDYFKRCLEFYRTKYINHRPLIEAVDVSYHYVPPCYRMYLGSFVVRGVTEDQDMQMLANLSSDSPEVTQWNLVRKNTVPGQPGIFGPIDIWYFNIPAHSVLLLSQKDYKVDFRGGKLEIRIQLY